MDGARRGRGGAGETFTYDFVAGPFGTHLYHCHSLPLASHIHRGLYGAFIVDPPGGRPRARDGVRPERALDTDFDGENDVYAANTIAFAYFNEPIPIAAGAAGPRRQHHRVRLGQLVPPPRQLLQPPARAPGSSQTS